MVNEIENTIPQRGDIFVHIIGIHREYGSYETNVAKPKDYRTLQGIIRGNTKEEGEKIRKIITVLSEENIDTFIIKNTADGISILNKLFKKFGYRVWAYFMIPVYQKDIPKKLIKSNKNLF